MKSEKLDGLYNSIYRSLYCNQSGFKQLFGTYESNFIPFEGQFSFLSHRELAIIEGFADEYRSNDKCLDIGCGNAQLSKKLAENGKGEWIGIDQSIEAINSALSTPSKNMKFIHCSMDDLPFSTEEFTFAIAIDSIQHSKNQCALASTLSNLMLKDGILIFTNWMKEGQSEDNYDDELLISLYNNGFSILESIETDPNLQHQIALYHSIFEKKSRTNVEPRCRDAVELLLSEAKYILSVRHEVSRYITIAKKTS